MSKPGWAYLRETYAEAWRVRVGSGDSSPDALIEAFRRSAPPDGMSEWAENLPGPVILGLWNRDVEPRNLRYELYKALARAVWQATVVPARAIYKNFR